VRWGLFTFMGTDNVPIDKVPCGSGIINTDKFLINTHLNSPNLRERLSALVHSGNGQSWWRPDLFSNIRPQLPSEIEIVEPPQKSNQYNCFLFALALHQDRQIIDDSGGFVYSSLVMELILRGELEIRKAPAVGNIVLYRNVKENPLEFTHAAILVGPARALSKWSWGPLIRHGVLDVPDFYGDDLVYTAPMSSVRAQQLYWKFRGANLLSPDVIRAKNERT